MLRFHTCAAFKRHLPWRHELQELLAREKEITKDKQKNVRFEKPVLRHLRLAVRSCIFDAFYVASIPIDDACKSFVQCDAAIKHKWANLEALFAGSADDDDLLSRVAKRFGTRVPGAVQGLPMAVYFLSEVCTELHSTGSFLCALIDLPLFRVYIDHINALLLGEQQGKVRSCTLACARGAEDPAGTGVLPDGWISANVGTATPLTLVRGSCLCLSWLNLSTVCV